MILYSKFLKFLSICNLSIALILTVLGFICPEQYEAGHIINSVGTVFGFWAFGCTLLLTFIFYAKLGSEKIGSLWELDWKRMSVYIIFVLNVIYRLFFQEKSVSANGDSMTGDKVLASISLALLLNFTVYILATQFVQLSADERNIK